MNGTTIIQRPEFGSLITAIQESGYSVIGPVRHDGAIIYDIVNSDADLPAGWTDEQEAGRYRLLKRTDQALFGYVVGPYAWKRFLHPPRTKLFDADRNGNSFTVKPNVETNPRFAFLGVRACELKAIQIQDKVLLGGPFSDPIYAARRQDVLLIAVQCTQAGKTCFCVSMNSGPRVKSGFDLALTEVLDKDAHYFVVECGSDRGAEILAKVKQTHATSEHIEKAHRLSEIAASQMGRNLETAGLPALLERNMEHPRWAEVAARCETCANCTMVCPTCFCSTVEDVSDLTGNHAERWRRWDSCFNLDFSYIHGGPARTSAPSRYRQWLTHKLGTWQDQFGTSGCVGCGRCITWCPVGIDITEEAREIRATDGALGHSPQEGDARE